MDWHKIEQTHSKFFWAKVAIGVMFIIIFVFQGYQYIQLKQEQVRLEEQLKALKEQNQELMEEKEKLQDPNSVESLAREELGLVKPGEVPYVK